MRLANGLGNLADLGRPVGVVADAVHLDEVEAPLGVELQHGVVVGLPGGIVGNALVAIVPGARGLLVGGVGGVKARARDGQILRRRPARGIPRTMWMPNLRPCAWTQSASGLKPCSVGGGGEARADRASEVRWRSKRYFWSTAFAPKGFCMYQPSSMTAYCQPCCLDAGEHLGVGAEFGLVDGEAVGVPAIPAHGGRGRHFTRIRCGKQRSQRRGHDYDPSKMSAQHAETYTTRRSKMRA